MRFSRELKALTAYPMRCRIMTKIMARILSKLVASGRLQVIHYMSARGFDEGQPYGKVWRAGANEATAIPRIGKAEQEIHEKVDTEPLCERSFAPKRRLLCKCSSGRG